MRWSSISTEGMIYIGTEGMILQQMYADDGVKGK